MSWRAQEPTVEHDRKSDKIMCGRFRLSLFLPSSRDTTCAWRKNQDKCDCNSINKDFVTSNSWAYVYVPSYKGTSNTMRSTKRFSRALWMCIRRKNGTRVNGHYLDQQKHVDCKKTAPRVVQILIHEQRRFMPCLVAYHGNMFVR